MGPRSTSTFLVLTAIVFAVFLAALAWRSFANGGAAAWVVAVGFVVAAAAVVLAVVFAQGVGEGRL